MVDVRINLDPQYDEWYAFLTRAYDEIDPVDAAKFSEEQDQNKLEDWVDLKYSLEYGKEHGVMVEARANGTLVGAAMAGKANPITWPDGHKMEIFLLAVDPDYRKQEVGSKILRFLEQEAKNKGADDLIVPTHVYLSSAQKFYESCGFENIGLVKKYYANGDAYFYQKRL